MNETGLKELTEAVADTLVRAGSVFPSDRYGAYARAIENDTELSVWAMEQIVDNAKVAEKNRSPLCDDTGIPHLLLQIGKNRSVSGDMLEAIYEGVRCGLRKLPGRPMAVKGNDKQRIEQSEGLMEDPAGLVPAPLSMEYVDDEERLRLYILMQGGGPEIRAKTYRVFHKHSMDTVLDEIIQWARESVSQLGCSPCTLAVGIGRSHFEASAMMLRAMTEGSYDIQNEYEKRITAAVNEGNTGALGLGGKNSVLGTFLKIGPQRASGVRIVCMRPCCCFEPRVAMLDL